MSSGKIIRGPITGPTDGFNTPVTLDTDGGPAISNPGTDIMWPFRVGSGGAFAGGFLDNVNNSIVWHGQGLPFDLYSPDTYLFIGPGDGYDARFPHTADRIFADNGADPQNKLDNPEHFGVKRTTSDKIEGYNFEPTPGNPYNVTRKGDATGFPLAQPRDVALFMANFLAWVSRARKVKLKRGVFTTSVNKTASTKGFPRYEPSSGGGGSSPEPAISGLTVAGEVPNVAALPETAAIGTLYWVNVSDDGPESPGPQFYVFNKPDEPIKRDRWTYAGKMGATDGTDRFPNGTFLKVVGSVSTPGQLPTTGVNEGDVYLVGTNVYVHDGVGFHNIGPIDSRVPPAGGNNMLPFPGGFEGLPAGQPPEVPDDLYNYPALYKATIQSEETQIGNVLPPYRAIENTQGLAQPNEHVTVSTYTVALNEGNIIKYDEVMAVAQYLQNYYHTAVNARDNLVVSAIVCHTSCHASCHTSRNRR